LSVAVGVVQLKKGTGTVDGTEELIGQTTTGGVMSTTVTCIGQLAVLLAASDALHTIVVVPIGKTNPA